MRPLMNQDNSSHRSSGYDHCDSWGNYQQQGSQNRNGNRDSNCNSNSSSNQQGQCSQYGQNNCNEQPRYNTHFQDRNWLNNENHHINDESNPEDRSITKETYHSDTNNEQDQESIKDNEFHFYDKDYQLPAGLLYTNKKETQHEYEMDNDSIPPLEPIPEYDMDDDSILPLKHINDQSNTFWMWHQSPDKKLTTALR